MRHPISLPDTISRCRWRSVSRIAVMVLAISCCALASTGVAATPESNAGGIPTTSAQVDFPATGVAPGELSSADLAQQWGIEVTSVRLTAHGHMIDYRYRVLDADKAADLFKRQIKPHLIHQETGSVLAVPDTAKLGPLRNSNMPQQGKIYWMFFANAAHLVSSGDMVTVVIGEFRVENLIVE